MVGSLPTPVIALGALALFGALAGCGTVVMSVASVAASGVSYALTDKSPSDHVVSVFAGQDCELFRFVRGEPICRDNPAPAPTQLASLADIAPAAGDAGEARPAPSYRMRAGAALPAERPAAGRVETAGLAPDEELYALVQDDGALEVFVHDPRGAAQGPNIRLVLRLERYAADPGVLDGIFFGGAFHRIEDITV